MTLAGLVAVLSALPIFSLMVTTVVPAVAVMGIGNGAVFRLVSDRFQTQIGSASGIIGAAGGFGGFLLPAWVGFLKDLSGTYRTGFLVFAAVSVAAWLSTLKAQRRAARIPKAIT
jgi:NNP family nitrate/nitrite transporter-like MFS transporter